MVCGKLKFLSGWNFSDSGDFSKRVFFDILFKQCSHKTIEKKPTIVFGKKEVVTLQLIF